MGIGILGSISPVLSNYRGAGKEPEKYFYPSLKAAFILSIIIGSISKDKIKYCYPLFVAIIFLPTIFIYYNESALVHSIWYLVISIIGLVIGTIINLIIKSRKEE
jgi:hypothetical protein